MVAAVIDHIEPGTFVLADGKASDTVMLGTTLLDTSKSAVFMSYRSDDAAPSNSFVRVEITNTTTLTFNRNGTSGAVVCQYYVVEWSAGVSVQRGTAVGNFSANPIQVSISGVTEASTFLIISLEKDGSTINQDDMFTAELTSPTNIDFTTITVPMGVGTKISWQAIEYDDCTVQRGTIAITGAEVSDTLTISAVVIAKSVILTTMTFDGTPWEPETGALHATLSATTTVTVSKEVAGPDILVSVEVVEFDDDTTVQRIAADMSTSVVQDDFEILTPVNTNFAIAISSGLHHSGGKSPYTVTDNPGPALATLDIDAGNNLEVIRALHGSSALTMEAYVVEFPSAVATRRRIIFIS